MKTSMKTESYFSRHLLNKITRKRPKLGFFWLELWNTRHNLINLRIGIRFNPHSPSFNDFNDYKNWDYYGF